MRSLARLKSDYQIYLVQTLTLLCSSQVEEYFISLAGDEWLMQRQALKEDIVLTSMNLDLSLKIINRKIKFV